MTSRTELIERFRAGEPEAVRAIYREFAGPIMTVAMAFVKDRELAADVVQQTFVKAWRAAAHFEGDELAPWLYSIARRSAIDLLRSESKPTRGGHTREVDLPIEPGSLEATWERFEVRRAIDSLPPEERDVVHRSHLLGYTHVQIAEQLGIPVGTVKSRSGRAHRRLAIALAHVVANQPPPATVLNTEEPT